MVSRVASALLLLTVAACASGPSNRELAPQPAAKAPVASILAVAEATRAEGRFAEAMQIYQEILVSDAKSVAAQYGVAECLLALGKAVDAQPMFDALTHDAEFHALALQGEGLSLLALNRRAPAAAQLREATDADPKLWRAYNGLGLISDLKRQPEEAGDFYAKALVLNPESDPPRMRVNLRKPQGPYKAGWQDITLPPQPRFVGDFKELARAIKSGQPLKHSYDHELLLQETLLRASGELS